MTSDPYDNGVPPDQATIGRALRLAQHLLENPDPDYDPGAAYWRGAIEALRWGLGRRGTAPVSQQNSAVDLGVEQRPAVKREARYAYECMRGDRRPPEEFGMRYLTGAEHTLCWIADGRGFIQPLDPAILREAYGIE